MTVAPQSRPARSENLGSSPDRPGAPKTPDSRPPDTSLDPPCGACACPKPDAHGICPPSYLPRRRPTAPTHRPLTTDPRQHPPDTSATHRPTPSTLDCSAASPTARSPTSAALPPPDMSPSRSTLLPLHPNRVAR